MTAGVHQMVCPSLSDPQPADNEVTIAIMGATGSGKTTFINLASGSDLRIGDGLESCTSIIQTSVPFELNRREVTLIDTPGFDNTNRSDADILKMIAMFLKVSYEHGKKLAGVIYMHRISDFRVGGIAKRNFSMFRGLCGDPTLRNVVIVTNMWGEVSLDIAERREYELRSKEQFFKPALDKDAQLFRHDNTFNSAMAILHHLIQNTPLPLQIQRELVDQCKDISQTCAGEELNREFLEQARKHREELLELQKEMKAAVRARDEETRRELEEARQELQEKLRKVESESQKLISDYAEEKERFERMVEETKQRAAQTDQRHTQQFEELQERLQQNSSMKATTASTDWDPLIQVAGAVLPMLAIIVNTWSHDTKLKGQQEERRRQGEERRRQEEEWRRQEEEKRRRSERSGVFKAIGGVADNLLGL